MSPDEKTPLRSLEDRLDRLTTSIDNIIKAVREEFTAIIEANDLRYQQRFEAQGKALDAAFGAAKGAVDAALAGADKGAVKTELSADKRFADLGDLIREQFKGINNKIEALSDRIKSTEDRLNTTSGEKAGMKHITDHNQVVKTNDNATWALVISIVVVAIALLALIFKP